MDTIECQYCHRQCVPRLLRYSPFPGPLRYAGTQHNCPFCGNTMYVTGGQFRLGMCLIAFAFALFGLGILMLIYFPHFNSTWILGFLFQLGLWGVIGWGIYGYARRKPRK